MDILDLLEVTVKHNASDLHVSAGLPPIIRVDGDLQRIDEQPFLHIDLFKSINELMTEQQRSAFANHIEIDFSFEIPNLARFRVNAFHQARGVAASFRVIPFDILSMDDLHLPTICKAIANHPSGLVLVTGPTGSGKSTTLAAMVDYINVSRFSHIITIEDPIEYVHTSASSLIHQREVFRDTNSFSAALRSALREDPDVILVGELRDLETIRLAITAAETGHLVLGTLHTQSAVSTINRMIDVFPGDEKSLIRSMLSESLQAVIAQQLIKKVGGGRIAAFELMMANTAIKHLIRENKLSQLYSMIQTGQAQGMMTLDQYLIHLMNNHVIFPETARAVAVNKSLF